LAEGARALAILLLLGPLAACAAPAGSQAASPAPVFFPRHSSPLGQGDAALLEGVARFADGCLWIETPAGERVLLLWPADTRLGLLNSQPAVFGPGDALLYEVGDVADDVYEIGGSSTALDDARQLVGEIPESCARDAFWVVSDVVEGP
jgi:hypothetical protein